MDDKKSDREKNSADQNADHLQQDEPGFKKKALKVGKLTLKASSKVLALDAIYNNARYMRPKNPRIWSDLFSKQGYETARKRFKHPKLQKTNGRVFISLALSIGISLLVFGYSILFIAGHPDPQTIPIINKIVLVGCALYGVISTAIYSLILVIKIKHQAQLAKNHSRAARS